MEAFRRTKGIARSPKEPTPHLGGQRRDDPAMGNLERPRKRGAGARLRCPVVAEIQRTSCLSI